MENREDEEVTHLQRHAMFFDRNKDGLIYPSETFEGCRAIGLGVVVSSLAAVFVNLLLSPKTRPGKPFSFSFPIEIKNIKFAKHTSDSGVFDKDGRFDEKKFDAIFATHALTHPNALTRKEVGALMKANRQPRDFGGWLGAFAEWPILYSVAKDKDGLLHKEMVRGVFDGTLFERLEEERAKKEK